LLSIRLVISIQARQIFFMPPNCQLPAHRFQINAFFNHFKQLQSERRTFLAIFAGFKESVS